MARNIFISYRRGDGRADARSIYQHLERRFGSRRLFMDVDTIRKGTDFRTVLDQALSRSGAMLVVIGPGWLEACDQAGRRRLEDPADFVRYEVAAGLRMKIPVVPVLVNGARMPTAHQLPDDIADLVFRQASVVTHENFPQDMQGLERDIAALVGAPARPAIWLAGGASVVGVAILAGFLAWPRSRSELRLVQPPLPEPSRQVPPRAGGEARPDPAIWMGPVRAEDPSMTLSNQPTPGNSQPSDIYIYGPLAQPETEATRVTAFDYRTPPGEIDPGLRRFRRQAGGAWHVTYPSGHVDKGAKIRVRAIVEGCAGTVIGKDAEPEFAVFIPDKGCPGMMARWRRGEGGWNLMGAMLNVR